MRRFSQRSALVTLSEINITPLLDLAFVLLIIFIITTPLLEQSITLKLPKGGSPEKQINQTDIRTVEVTLDGKYLLGRQRMSLDQVEANLLRDFQTNPNLIVYIRADEMGRNRDTYAIIDRCQKRGITRYSLRTEPPGRRP
jgi:biopolymer transport protein ExbD